MSDVFFDTHAHIDGPIFDQDRDEMLARARAAGVSHIVCIGASDQMVANERTLALVREHPELYATVGVHPHDARIVTPEVLGTIEKWCEDEKVVAIGETGLDYHYDHSPRDEQQSAFRAFIQMAHRQKLPIVVHTRDAEEDTIRILQEEKANAVGGVFHCFSGSMSLAEAALEMGFYISFSGILTFKTAEEIREVAKMCPHDRVLVETDCPYLAPIPHRGKRNEPAYVAHTASKLAELWGIPVEEVRHQSGQNALRFFSIEV